MKAKGAAAVIELEAPAPRRDDRLIRIDAVAALVSLAPRTIHKMIARGKFPRAIAIDGGERTAPGVARQQRARWSANEIQDWIAAQLVARGGAA